MFNFSKTFFLCVVIIRLQSVLIFYRKLCILKIEQFGCSCGKIWHLYIYYPYSSFICFLIFPGLHSWLMYMKLAKCLFKIGANKFYVLKSLHKGMMTDGWLLTSKCLCIPFGSYAKSIWKCLHSNFKHLMLQSGCLFQTAFNLISFILSKRRLKGLYYSCHLPNYLLIKKDCTTFGGYGYNTAC